MKPGDFMPDGSIFAGINPANGFELFTKGFDWEDKKSHAEAFYLCGQLWLCGHKDWRLPTEDELRVLFINRQAIGNFQEKNYWSAFPKHLGVVWIIDFRTGKRTMIKHSGDQMKKFRFRPVRGREM